VRRRNRTHFQPTDDAKYSFFPLLLFFLFLISHEIRTPINGILGMSNLLRTTILSSEQEEYAAAIEFSSNHLLGVISDILDFSRLESGKLELTWAPFSLFNVVEDSLDMAFQPTKHAGMEIIHLLEIGGVVPHVQLTKGAGEPNGTHSNEDSRLLIPAKASALLNSMVVEPSAPGTVVKPRASFSSVAIGEKAESPVDHSASSSLVPAASLWYSGLPPVVLGDEQRVRQILVNFLSNSLKFSNSGGEIEIDVWFAATVADLKKKGFRSGGPAHHPKGTDRDSWGPRAWFDARIGSVGSGGGGGGGAGGGAAPASNLSHEARSVDATPTSDHDVWISSHAGGTMGVVGVADGSRTPSKLGSGVVTSTRTSPRFGPISLGGGGFCYLPPVRILDGVDISPPAATRESIWHVTPNVVAIGGKTVVVDPTQMEIPAEQAQQQQPQKKLPRARSSSISNGAPSVASESLNVDSSVTPEAKPRRIRCPSHPGPWVVFSVRDTGAGIAKSVQGRLFRPFTQLDNSSTRRFQGTGLGLVISMKLAKAMKGHIWLVSEEGKGSVFNFALPLKLPATSVPNASLNVNGSAPAAATSGSNEAGVKKPSSVVKRSPPSFARSVPPVESSPSPSPAPSPSSRSHPAPALAVSSSVLRPLPTPRAACVVVAAPNPNQRYALYYFLRRQFEEVELCGTAEEAIAAAGKRIGKKPKQPQQQDQSSAHVSSSTAVRVPPLSFRVGSELSDDHGSLLPLAAVVIDISLMAMSPGERNASEGSSSSGFAVAEKIREAENKAAAALESSKPAGGTGAESGRIRRTPFIFMRPKYAAQAAALAAPAGLLPQPASVSSPPVVLPPRNESAPLEPTARGDLGVPNMITMHQQQPSATTAAPVLNPSRSRTPSISVAGPKFHDEDMHLYEIELQPMPPSKSTVERDQLPNRDSTGAANFASSPTQAHEAETPLLERTSAQPTQADARSSAAAPFGFPGSGMSLQLVRYPSLSPEASFPRSGFALSSVRPLLPSCEPNLLLPYETVHKPVRHSRLLQAILAAMESAPTYVQREDETTRMKRHERSTGMGTTQPSNAVRLQQNASVNGSQHSQNATPQLSALGVPVLPSPGTLGPAALVPQQQLESVTSDPAVALQSEAAAAHPPIRVASDPGSIPATAQIPVMLHTAVSYSSSPLGGGAPVTAISPLLPASSSGPKPAILIVEDQIINVKLLSKMLGKLGYPCKVAEDGILAVEAMRDKFFPIVLMDVQM
jgi:signal transduction histidine kinase/CheY-like chemotaxis protein